MTKANILAVIKEVNENKDIKWNVTKNTKKEVVVVNDYDESIKFSISLKVSEATGDEYLSITDRWGESIGCLLKGTEFWADFSEMEDGITKAVKKVVRHFYYYY